MVSLSCDCGKTSWETTASPPRMATLVKCYCKDCAAFAHHTGKAETMIDKNGAATVLQVLPETVKITKGRENLALLRLSPRGAFRWYTSCCNTPVANTTTRMGAPFASLVIPAEGFDLGKPMAHVNTGGKDKGMARVVWRVARGMIATRLTGRHRLTPFFDPETGAPVCTPKVLSLEERRAATP